MPFTLSHPAAVLPLMRRPFVPAALVAGALAPDVPYFLATLGLSGSGGHSWSEPFLNATTTHSPGGGLITGLPVALGLIALHQMLRAPVSALLPSGLRLPEPERPVGTHARARYVLWLLLSALIGIASHLAWDSFTHGDGLLVTQLELLRTPVLGGLTVGRLLQHVSTAAGLAAVTWHLWRRRGRLRSPGAGTVNRLRPVMRWCVVAVLVASPVLGAAVKARDDFHAHRYVTEADYTRPVTVDLGGGVTETTYPSTTAPAPLGTLAEGMLTGAAKRAGVAFTVALLLYAAAWQTGSLPHRRRRRRAGLVGHHRPETHPARVDEPSSSPAQATTAGGRPCPP
ncbi:DUF4184 family protein [Streptomyces sodiiphilus]|uniref:DUF4184 family protein n=1 Tax=Streptomyces sodiiphilus TaxID=226217 RepID=A0ABP5B107_9ACTN